VSDFELALAHYRLSFPDLSSLGSGTPPAAWKTEYDRVAAFGLTATLLTSSSSVAGSASSQKNFDQKTLLHALHTRRSELDSTYATALSVPVTPRRNLGITLNI